ncbi:MAG: patatin, partial [Gammaproteobacteria bacterium]|nr:patatin [Gammaproteobacteria bacterium]
AISSCGRPMRRVRFPNRAVPASMMPYLGLDDARETAMDRLVAQAHTDADLTKSYCDDPNSEDGRLIHRLMNSLPAMPANGAVWDRTPVDNTRNKEE